MKAKEKDNPWSYAYNSVLQDQTSRQPNMKAFGTYIPIYKKDIDKSYCMKNFTQSSALIEMVHNSVHLNVGGDMAFLSYSAFDPIFFLQTSTIQKIFRGYQLCQEEFYASSWIENLPKEVLDMPLQCFSNPKINKNPKTANQTIGKVLTNRKKVCYVYHDIEDKELKCTRKCNEEEGPARYLVYLRRQTQISAKLEIDLCIVCDENCPSGACIDGCCKIASTEITYFGYGSRHLRAMRQNEASYTPYYLDITDFLKGYPGYNNNETWLATVPVQTRITSFKDYTGEKDLPQSWVDIYPYSVFKENQDANEDVTIYFGTPNYGLILKPWGTTFMFWLNGNMVIYPLWNVWEFDDGQAYNVCDETRMKKVKTPTTPSLGYHFYYFGPAAPNCTSLYKAVVQIYPLT